MRLALTVEYDGTDFNGSQFQLNARTVQGELEAAATTIFGAEIGRARLASRTDAGVHATGQVATLDVVTAMRLAEAMRALNGNLPPDVAVTRVSQVAADFDPRRAAVARTYRYVINDGGARSPLRRRYEHHHRRRLDVAAMADAATLFVGNHDVAAFAAASSDDGSTVRDVFSATVTREAVDGRIVFEIRANAFVRQQIRRMAAALIAVGDGARTVGWVRSLLADARYGAATQNSPPRGLTLMRVDYPEGDVAW